MKIWVVLVVAVLAFAGAMPATAQEGPPYEPSQPIVTPTPRPYNTPHLGRFVVQFANGWYRDPQLPAIVARVIEQAKLGTWVGGTDPYLPLGKGVGPGITVVKISGDPTKQQTFGSLLVVLATIRLTYRRFNPRSGEPIMFGFGVGSGLSPGITSGAAFENRTFWELLAFRSAADGALRNFRSFP